MIKNLFPNLSRFALSSALGLLAVLPALAGTRTFTDQQGRKIEAEITAVTGSKVTLRLTSGKSYTIPIAKLSETDQFIVKVWGEEQAKPGKTKASGSGGAVPENIRYDFEIEVDKERTLRGSKVEVDSGEMKADEWVYEIALENRSRVELEGLEVSYRIYVDPKASAKMTFDSPPKVYGGRTKLKTVANRASVTVKTNAVPLKELELNADYVFRDGSRNNLEDKIEGVWIKLWHGDKKVAEYRSSNSTVKKATWGDDEAADPNAAQEE